VDKVVAAFTSCAIVNATFTKKKEFPMGEVVRFRRQRIHARAPAKRVKISAVNPASLARAVPKMEPQCSGGILSLCDHLRTASHLTPISVANTIVDGQSLTTSRNDLKIMPRNMGHNVPQSKHFLSHDPAAAPAHSVGMVDEADYKRGFLARTRAAREGRQWRQEDIAELMGMDRNHYKQFETRTYLPRHLMPLFCKLTGISLEYLLTGHDKGAATVPAAPLDAVGGKVRKNGKSRRGAA
jgi:ribosome-binding protein aMBF1 (putative translation factor)